VTFSGKGSFYPSEVNLNMANADLWKVLAATPSGKIMDFDMTAEGYGKDFISSNLTTIVKNAHKSGILLRINMVSNNESSTGTVFDAKNSNIVLAIAYTIATPSASVSIAGDASIKQGSTATYTATYTGSGTPTYSWNVSSGLSIVSGQGTKTVVIKANAAGNQSVKVAAGTASDTKNVTVTSDVTAITNQIISSNINYSNRVINITNSSVTNKATVNFTANQLITITPNSWFLAGTKVKFKATGTTLRSEDLFGLPEVLATDLTSEIFKDQISIYPVPVKNELNINLGSSLDLVKELHLYNSVGALIERRTPFSNLEQIDMQRYSNGFYILRIVYKDGTVESQKLILAK